MVLIIVCIIAGLGAGIGTGLAGLSAAVVITPMLITFCGFSAYEAVGIAWMLRKWHRCMCMMYTPLSPVLRKN